MIDINTIQREQRTWEHLNFGDTPVTYPMLGMTEELGELSHAVLKNLQGIRGKEEINREEEMDALGDILIYMISFCNKRGYNLEEILTTTWNHVRQRNWTDNPTTG